MTSKTKILMALCPLAASMTLACGGNDDLDAEPMDMGTDVKPRLEQVQLTRLEITSDDGPSMLHPVDVEFELDVIGDAFEADAMVGLRADDGQLGCIIGAFSIAQDEPGTSHVSEHNELFVRGDCAALIDRDDVELFVAFDPWGEVDYERQGVEAERPAVLYDVARGSVLDTDDCTECRVATRLVDSPGVDAQLREVSLASSVAVLSRPAAPDQEAMPADETPHFSISSGVRVTGLPRGQAPRDGETFMTYRIRPLAGAPGTEDLAARQLDWALLHESRLDDEGHEHRGDRTTLDIRGQTPMQRASAVYIGDDLADRMAAGDWHGVEEFEVQTCVTGDYPQAVYPGEGAPRDNDCAVLPVVVVREYVNADGSTDRDTADALAGGGKARAAKVWSTGWSTTNNFAGHSYTNGIDFETWIDLNASDVATTTYGGRTVSGPGSWFEAGANSTATVFNSEITVLDAYLTAIGYNADPAASGLEAKVEGLGMTFFDTGGLLSAQDGAELTLEQALAAAGESTQTTLSHEIPLAGYSFDDGCATVGASLKLAADIGLDGTETKVNIDALGNGVQLTGTIVPTVQVWAISKAEFAYDGFLSFGVALEMGLQIFGISLPFTATAAAIVGTPSTLDFSQSALLELSSLAGYIDFSFFYKICGICKKKDHTHRLVQWTGIQNTWPLFNLQQSVPFGPGIDPGDVELASDDIVLWSPSTRHIKYIVMANGEELEERDLINPLPASLEPHSVGNPDGDGDADILLFDVGNGHTAYLKTADGQQDGTGVIQIIPSADWTLRGIGDLNGDGHEDVVWRHDTNLIHYWSVANGAWTGSHNVQHVAADWTLVALGDISHDYREDFVFMKPNGQIHIWDWVAEYDLGNPVGSEWTLQDIGDLDGDNQADILWRHDNGMLHYWKMEDGAHVSSHDIKVLSGDWVVLGVGNIVD